MIKKIIKTLFPTLFIICNGYSQTITGKVEDENGDKLESATIYAESLKDSTLISYTISNSEGIFEFDVPSKSEYNLFVSYTGYENFQLKVKPAKKEIDLGNIRLNPLMQKLTAVELTGKAPPVTIKNDTIEFNAGSYATKGDTNLEEILKRLPGVSINRDGSIEVNGQKVNNIQVNGSTFFGKDPKLVTKNLPKEIIDKIQITSTKTETDKFVGKTSEDSGKTINVTIKKDKDKGFIAKVNAGYGTDERYQFNAIGNYLNDKERISVLVGKNNINNSGFSFDDVYDMIGNRQSLSGRGNDFELDDISFSSDEGITTSTLGGISYSNIFKNKSELGMNYFYGSADLKNSKVRTRKNIFPDGEFYSKNESKLTQESKAHRADADFQFDIDSTLRVIIEPTFNLTKRKTSLIQNEITGENDTDITSSADIENYDENNHNRFTNSLNFMKKFKQKYTYVSLSFMNSHITDDLNENYISDINNDENQTVNQFVDQYEKQNSYNLNLEQKIHLIKNFYTFYSVDHNTSLQNNERDVFDLNTLDNQHDVLIDSLSSKFEYKTYEFKTKLGLSYFISNKMNLKLSGSYRNIRISRSDSFQNLYKKDVYDYSFLEGSLFYKFNKSLWMNLNYNVSNNLPSIRELQPISNISNPLYIISGNSMLEPETEHNFRVSFYRYNRQKRTGLFINFGGNYTNNKIMLKKSLGDNLTQQVTYTNLNNYLYMSGGIGGSMRLKDKNNIILNLKPNLGLRYSQVPIDNNNQRFDSKSYSILPSLGVLFSYKDLFDIEPFYRINFHNTKYSINTIDENNYTSHYLTFRATTYWPEWLIFGNEITYNYNGNISGGLEKSSLLWNMSISVAVLNENANLKLTGFDLLNKNNNSYQVINEDYVMTEQNTVLNQYFMISFIYKFNNFQKKN